ncbi:MAG: hypothetical protein VX641_05090 [Planctomycetota bacterium]|nr:hypothetical protein [Planctomycetota bacterium]
MHSLFTRIPSAFLAALSVTSACVVSVQTSAGLSPSPPVSSTAGQSASETPVQASPADRQVEFTQEEFAAQRLRMDTLVASGALTDQQRRVRIDRMQAMLDDPASTARMFTLYVRGREQLDQQFDSGAISAFSRHVQMEALDSMIFGAPGPKPGNPTEQLEEGVAFGIGLPILYTTLQKQMEPDEDPDPKVLDKRILRRLEVLYRTMGADGRLAPKQLEQRLANLLDLPRLEAQLARMQANEELGKARVRLQRMVDRGELSREQMNQRLARLREQSAASMPPPTPADYESQARALARYVELGVITPEQMQARLDELARRTESSDVTEDGAKQPPSTPPLETTPEERPE